MTMIGICCPLGPRWYLVRTQRHREEAAKQAIEVLGIETYLPMETHWARHARKVERKSAPLFRQYLFTRFDMGRDPWWAIDSTRHVDRLEKRDEIPLRVPDKQVDVIRRGDENGLFDFTREAFPQGCKVRIIEGPFANFCAEVQRSTPKGRIDLLLGALGRIQIDRLHLEKI